MRTPKRILVATDFSKCSQSAVEYAAFLATQLDATLEVLHVWQAPHDLGPAVAQYMVVDPYGDKKPVRKIVEEHAENSLAEVLQSLESQPLTEVHSTLEEGAARQAIVAVAERGKHDLIVLGTHGRTGLAHLVMGSVAEWVIRHATAPVVSVRTPPGEVEVIDAAPAADATEG